MKRPFHEDRTHAAADQDKDTNDVHSNSLNKLRLLPSLRRLDPQCGGFAIIYPPDFTQFALFRQRRLGLLFQAETGARQVQRRVG